MLRHFFNPAVSQAALSEFQGRSPAGATALAVRVFVAPTLPSAQAQADAYLLWRSRMDPGADEPLLSSSDTSGHAWTPVERARAGNRAAIVVGTPEMVYARLAGLAEENGVGEVMVNTLAHDPRTASAPTACWLRSPADSRGSRGFRVAWAPVRRRPARPLSQCSDRRRSIRR